MQRVGDGGVYGLELVADSGFPVLKYSDWLATSVEVDSMVRWLASRSSSEREPTMSMITGTTAGVGPMTRVQNQYRYKNR